MRVENEIRSRRPSNAFVRGDPGKNDGARASGCEAKRRVQQVESTLDRSISSPPCRAKGTTFSWHFDGRAWAVIPTSAADCRKRTLRTFNNSLRPLWPRGSRIGALRRDDIASGAAAAIRALQSVDRPVNRSLARDKFVLPWNLAVTGFSESVVQQPCANLGGLRGSPPRESTRPAPALETNPQGGA